VQLDGGITAHLFAHAVTQLLIFGSERKHSIADRAAALSGLVPLRLCSIAAAEMNSGAAAPVLDSYAARCATDPLCLIFSYLSVREFRDSAACVCRSWRSVRLHAAAWPSAGDVAVYTYMLLHESPAVLLHALRSLRGELMADHTLLTGVIQRPQLERLVQLLSSDNADVQVRMSPAHILHPASSTLVTQCLCHVTVLVHCS